MNKTVDNIQYLCCVADTKEFYGFDSIEFQSWEVKARMQFENEENWSKYEDWLIDKYIPLYRGYPTSDLDMIYLPKVFKTNNVNLINHINNLARKIHMNISVNINKKLILIL